MTAKKLRPTLSKAWAAVFLAALAAPLAAASRSAGDLALVPVDASTVAVVRLSDLRESPLASRVFADADRMTADGDAARFLEEAQLNPKKDVDTVVIASKGSGRSESQVLVMFEGRFDPDRLAAAAVTRGAARRTTSAGDYYLLPEHHSGESAKPAAAAFVAPNLVIVGTESLVAQALTDRQAGGTAFASGSGLGRELKRVDQGATLWVLVDVSRYPALARQRARAEARGEDGAEPAQAILGAMRSVTLIAVQAKAAGDSLEISATGLSGDAETRQLLEDSLRGVMAMWRLAAQEKSPELVSILRKFTVSSDNESVSVHGTLPGSLLRTFAAHAHHKKAESD